jgi:integrase/recombinase XerC
MHITSFIEYLKIEKGYAAHTLLAYEKDLLSFQSFLEKTYNIKDISSVSYVYVRAWTVQLMEQGMSMKTINRKMSTLRSLFKFLLKNETLHNNPMSAHKPLKNEKKVIVAFSKKEMQKVNELMNGDDFESVRDKVVIELLYTTGMRRAELLKLQLSNIDFHQKQLKVLGKRNKERNIPILEETIKLLDKYIVLRNKLPYKDDKLIVTKKGKPAYDSLIYRIVHKYMSLVSPKEKLSPHVLRHAFATHLLDEGSDLNSVKELLGHSSLASTQVYTHTSLQKLKETYHKAHPRNK